MLKLIGTFGALGCSIVFLVLCKEYLNIATCRTSFLLLIKSWTFWYIKRLSMSSYRPTKVNLYTFKNGPVFWSTLYNSVLCVVRRTWASQQWEQWYY